jgi:16S rRNA (cytosine967-C5)-methyltransferase
MDRLPGFTQGMVSVQDEAAQLAAGLLDLQPGQLVLDLCAAPGGKTLAMLESCPNLAQMLAVDISAERLQRVRDNLDRAGLDAQLREGDATDPASWWDGIAFDRILLDVPCSALGVIRRHPDIKLLRRPTDIAALQEQQARILKTAWGMLKPGGRMLYVTCSVLQQENEQSLDQFLQLHEDAREIRIEADWGLERLVGRQILTGQQGMDGFYYGLVEKSAP